MKLIIDIDEEVYKEYMNLATGRIPTYKACYIAYVLRNGMLLDDIKAEIDNQYKWLMQTNHTLYDIDIAFDAIKQFIDRHIGGRSEYDRGQSNKS